MSELDQKTARIVAEKYSARFMSNSKWHKMLEHLTEVFDELHVNYKLIYDETVSSTRIDAPDHKPFFQEPVFYREIEWLEFPAAFLDFVSRDDHKAGKKYFPQDTNRILKLLSKIGKFEVDQTDQGIRIYGYR